MKKRRETESPRPEPRSVVHTSAPNRYWAIVRSFVPEGNRLPRPTALLAGSKILSAGGLRGDRPLRGAVDSAGARHHQKRRAVEKAARRLPVQYYGERTR